MSNLVETLKKEIESSRTTTSKKNIGSITEISDGVLKVSGLSDVSYNELVSLPGNLQGLALNLEEDQVGVVVFGDYKNLKEGDEVTTTGQLLSIPIGEEFIGRVVDPLGKPTDGKGSVKAKTTYPIEKIAPGVIARASVNTPLQTGIAAIDSMIPIGRGQRELIIGDRGTGKTAITLDTIINQKDSDVICVYVAIGQKTSKIAQIIDTLESHGAMKHTIIVNATAADSAALQYLAPYAGCAIGEYFMDQGKDALVIYDDLTKHAWAYRQISLLLRRPSGREAYPGDVFYLHSRLLERAARMSEKSGGGSLTALPIIETQAGDLSAYIPTNVISITDGQIFLETDMFNAGSRPAVNVGLSVSRVGGAAQIKAMKQVAGSLRLDLAQFRSLEAFAQFGSDLDETTKQQLDRGRRIVEILKQPQYAPIPVEQQVSIIWAVTNGHLDDIAIEAVESFQEKYLDSLSTKGKKILEALSKEKTLSEKLTNDLETFTKDFKKGFKV